MKPMKLTSLVMMLLIAFSAAAQEEFFDDVYFSSKNKKKKEQVEEKKVVQPKQESRALVATAKSPASSDSRDVDEYIFFQKVLKSSVFRYDSQITTLHHAS